MQVFCPNCRRPFEITTPGFTGSVSCPYCGQPVNVTSDAEVVDRVAPDPNTAGYTAPDPDAAYCDNPYIAAMPPRKRKLFQVFGKLGLIFGYITFPVSICGLIPFLGIVVFYTLLYFPLPVAGLVFSILAREKKGIVFNSIAIGLSLLALPIFLFWAAMLD